MADQTVTDVIIEALAYEERCSLTQIADCRDARKNPAGCQCETLALAVQRGLAKAGWVITTERSRAGK